MDADFRFRIAPLGEWLAEVDEHENGHWLDLGLGVEVDGERMDLLPLLVELLKRFDRDLSPRALAEMDDDAKLAAPLDDGRFVLGELWSLLDFLLPDLLWDERRFRRLFRTPIERFGDTARQEQLRRRVAPFLLRRTKEAVAAELPPKHAGVDRGGVDAPRDAGE